jgi:hypothetical protein
MPIHYRRPIYLFVDAVTNLYHIASNDRIMCRLAGGTYRNLEDEAGQLFQNFGDNIQDHVTSQTRRPYSTKDSVLVSCQPYSYYMPNPFQCNLYTIVAY